MFVKKSYWVCFQFLWFYTSVSVSFFLFWKSVISNYINIIIDSRFPTMSVKHFQITFKSTKWILSFCKFFWSLVYISLCTFSSRVAFWRDPKWFFYCVTRVFLLLTILVPFLIYKIFSQFKSKLYMKWYSQAISLPSLLLSCQLSHPL